MTHNESVEIMRRMGIGSTVKPMPKARTLTVRDAERIRAAKMLAAAIQDSIAACEELEREA